MDERQTMTLVISPLPITFSGKYTQNSLHFSLLISIISTLGVSYSSLPAKIYDGLRKRCSRSIYPLHTVYGGAIAFKVLIPWVLFFVSGIYILYTSTAR